MEFNQERDNIGDRQETTSQIQEYLASWSMVLFQREPKFLLELTELYYLTAHKIMEVTLLLNMNFKS